MKRFWLMKSEPDVYGIDDLEKDKVGEWEGVRNYQARNFMREMKVGDEVLFYHSNAKPPGIAGIARIKREAYPDPYQFNRTSKYYDPKSDKEKPRWSCVDLAFVEKFSQEISLEELKSDPKLSDMLVTRRGQRLSVQPVDSTHFKYICKLAQKRKPS